MKNKYLLLIALPLLIAGCDKKTPKIKFEETYSAEGKMTQKLSYSYKKGKVSEILYEYFNDDGSVEKTKSIFEYDGDNVVLNTSMFYDAKTDVWGETYYSYFTYDKNGNMISTIDTIVGEHGATPYSVLVQTFNDNNLLTEIESFDYFDGSFSTTMKIEYEYNDQAQKIKEKNYTSMFSTNNELELFSYNVFSYDEVSYDKQGLLTSIKEYSDEDELGYITRYTYDKSSFNLIEEVTSEVDETNEKVKIKCTYEYDKKGNMSKMSYYHLDDERVNLILDSYTVYKY